MRSQVWTLLLLICMAFADAKEGAPPQKTYSLPTLEEPTLPKRKLPQNSRLNLSRFRCNPVPSAFSPSGDDFLHDETCGFIQLTRGDLKTYEEANESCAIWLLKKLPLRGESTLHFGVVQGPLAAAAQCWRTAPSQKVTQVMEVEICWLESCAHEVLIGDLCPRCCQF
jgi:hypothetical protein